ncbi:MAG: transporter permease [Acidimicrobiaceae bacterium]|jgi:ABC-type uncharacterized transport system permease subunit|nr:transporter permease [Acidimicrobiaceae bacterium]
MTGPLDGRSQRRAVLMLLACFAALTAMAIDAGNRKTLLVLGANGIASKPLVDVPIWQICSVGAALCIGGIAVTATADRHRRATLGKRASIFTAVAAVLLGYLTWAPNGSTVSLSNILVAAMGATTPLLLGSAAGVLSERSGVINIAIEGQFLASACSGAVVATVTHSAVLGLVTGIAAGMLVGLLLSLLAIRYRVDQIVAGLILITLITGVTGYVTEQFLDPNSTAFNTPATFQALGIPGLDSIPIIGKALFDENILFYLAVAIVVAVELTFARTALGLRIRASGENPAAALSSGVNVRRLRYGAGIVAGGIAGAGGTYFTLGSAGQFVAQMTAGLGYVSLAAVIFGGWRASRAAGAALLFGLASSIATSLGLLNVQVNPELLITAPYIVTIIVLAGAVGGGKAPAADGVPLSDA